MLAKPPLRRCPQKTPKTSSALLPLSISLIGYPLLILTSCQALQSGRPDTPTPNAPSEQAPFPNILENLENAPPFGDPILYKEWKKKNKPQP